MALQIERIIPVDPVAQAAAAAYTGSLEPGMPPDPALARVVPNGEPIVERFYVRVETLLWDKQKGNWTAVFGVHRTAEKAAPTDGYLPPPLETINVVDIEVETGQTPIEAAYAKALALGIGENIESV